MRVAPEVRDSGQPAATADELSSVLQDYMVVTQRLQQTHETLQREVVRLRGEVETKDRELERRRRLASLGELAAGVAHEVRNPLGAIRLYSGLLRGQLGEGAPMIDLIEKIDAGIRAIDCVVEDTLALAPRGGQLSARPLRDIIADACEMCRGTLAAEGVELETRHDVAADADDVMADGTALQRVFVNLIANAAQASPAGSVVTVEVLPDVGGRLAARVRDEGPGLPEELIEKIFDPFFTTKEQGTGLGLTIAHRLVEAHGGDLAARNRPEGGAEFVVTLPHAGGEEEHQASELDAGQPSAA